MRLKLAPRRQICSERLKSAILKRSAILFGTGLTVFFGCNPATEAGTVKAARAIEQEFGVLKRSEKLVSEFIIAGKLQQARGEAEQVALQTEKLRISLNTSELAGPNVEFFSKMALEAELAKMETDQRIAVATAFDNLRNEPGPLSRESKEYLKDFLQDFLCLNLEKVVTERRLPSQDEYWTFLATKGFDDAFPLAKLLDQASAVADFARSLSDDHSSNEFQAQLRLLRECHFKE